MALCLMLEGYVYDQLYIHSHSKVYTGPDPSQRMATANYTEVTPPLASGDPLSTPIPSSPIKPERPCRVQREIVGVLRILVLLAQLV